MLGAAVAQAVKCLTTGWTIGWSRFDPLQGQRIFPSSLCVQTGSEAHPASYPMGTGGSYTSSPPMRLHGV
jgi:hypothetical protein